MVGLVPSHVEGLVDWSDLFICFLPSPDAFPVGVEGAENDEVVKDVKCVVEEHGAEQNDRRLPLIKIGNGADNEEEPDREEIVGGKARELLVAVFYRHPKVAQLKMPEVIPDDF